jgi:protein MpaA
MTRSRALRLLVAAGLLAALLPVWASSASAVIKPVTDSTRAWRAAAPATLVIGHSVLGRAIVAHRTGPADAPYVLLVIGQMHGNEPRGRDVAREVAARTPIAGLQVWTISTMNPDGAIARRRTNAHGVDLNRNFPYGWRRTPGPQRLYYAGPRAASEPETRAMMVFLDRLRPDLVVSLHQAFRSVDVGNPRTSVWARRLATLLRLQMRAVPCAGPCSGTLTSWFNSRYAGAALTVELPSVVTPAWAAYDAKAILLVARALVPPAPPAPTPTPTPTPTATATPTPTPTG